MMRLSLATLPLALVMIVSSCGGAEERSEGGSTGRASTGLPLPYDSMLLAEDDEIYIGNPYSLRVVRAKEGGGRLREVWVSDFFSNSILQFDGDGVFRRRIGRPGPGPHEFSAITLLFLPDSEEVGAVDFRRHEIKWFDRESGELRRFVRHEQGKMGRSPPVKIDGGAPRLVFPLLNQTSQTSLGFLDLDSETWTHTGPFPNPYRRSVEQGRGALAALFGNVAVDRLDEAAV